MANPSDVEITLEGEEDEQGMIGGIPMGLYKKLQLAQKNSDAADAVRKEKAELAALKKKRAEDQAARIEKLKAKRATRHAEAKQEHLDHVQSVGQETRKQVKEAEAQRKLACTESPAVRQSAPGRGAVAQDPQSKRRRSRWEMVSPFLAVRHWNSDSPALRSEKSLRRSV